jgi:hypothetical protein
MKQHTPGPWAIESPDISGAPFRVRKSENHPQGDLTICHVNPYLSYESEANAQLIAAAPDLLSALERLAQDYAALMNSQGAAIDIGQPGSEFTAGQWVGARLGSPVLEAWKAIAKAKGEA